MTAHESAPMNPERERFEALIRDSPLNVNPEGDIRQYRIGKRADEFARKGTPPDRRAVLAREMSQIHEAEANERQAARDARVAVERANPPASERAPMLQLVHDLIDASVERARLGVPAPPALDAIPTGRVSGDDIGARVREALEQSVQQSRSACEVAAEIEKRRQAERMAARSSAPTPQPAGETR